MTTAPPYCKLYSCWHGFVRAEIVAHEHPCARKRAWYNFAIEEELNAVTEMLTGQGHTVRQHIRYGKLWFEIDGNMLATRQEMLELRDGVYSLIELRELFERRRAEAQSPP
jgi:hypothetical protein